MAVAETRIPCSTETREKIKSRGAKGETYDEILRRLLDDDDRQSSGD
jgi:hypothetical protein